jgi:hypothetical protein
MAPAPLADLFGRITAFSNLLAAARRAQKGKCFRPDVLAFNACLEAELFRLQEELSTFTHRHLNQLQRHRDPTRGA